MGAAFTAAGWAALCLLTGCSRDSDVGARASGEPLAVDAGARLYAQNCVPCHREDGEGVASVYPALAASPVVNGDPVELAQWVLRGKRPSSLPSGRYPTQMLAFGWMKDADAAALLTYVRSHFGNDAPPLDASSVAKAR